MAVNIHITIIELNALHTKRQNLFQELDAVIHLLMEAKHWGLPSEISESVNFCVMEAIKLCRLDTPIIFIEARINLSRFVVTGCAAKTSATVTFPSLNLISLFAFCFNIWLNGVASYPSLVSWIKHSVDRFVIVSIFIPKLRLILILNSFLGSSDSLVFSELFHSLAPRPLAARSISDFLLTYLAT